MSASRSRTEPDPRPVDQLTEEEARDELDALAEEFELSGGSIFNAVLGSAFLAAEAGTPITMELAVAALRREMQKMGRLVTDESFSRFAEGP